ncbi:S8 family serine peptidase [Phycicoccus sp. BSK3Z-2]|uniref:S8 family serine peptidase n=1 Tax=Phycicoccus avicenniae TaxID=2828860 RepID=A0A941HZD0_9MICO|nr:S8 family serine peptidase [Phycicoccus avicenniae]MBR7742837.1 S8 family serine peptidase [Phycicoccus avicenniae]
MLLAGAVAGVVTVPGPAVGADSCEEGRTRYVADTPAGLVRLGASQAWPLATGAGTTVAVLDSGVADANAHFPDGSVLPGRSFVGGSATEDVRLHGTAVAGVVAARPVEGSGVVGLARGASVLPVKVVADDTREGPDADAGVLAEAIAYAADEGAEVIVVALSTFVDDARLRDATAAALRSGSLVVASAGNRASKDDPATGVRYPAGYPGVLGVAATDDGDRVAENAVRGPHVDLAAPGVEVLTTYGAWGDCYLSADAGSSSYATGYVAAAAALVAQRYPGAGPRGWAHRLEATAARARRDARDDVVGWGVVQPVAALTAVLDGSLAGPPPPGSSPAPSEEAPVERLAVTQVPDPGAADRRRVTWVAVGATGLLLALALLRLGRTRRGG